jgi:hypothetical protein
MHPTTGDVSMKRMVKNALCASMVIVLLGVTGCDGGGPPVGMPQDTTVSPEMRDQMKAMTDMTKTPPPTVAPPKAK